MNNGEKIIIASMIILSLLACFYKVQNLNLEARISTLQSDSIQSHKTILKLNNYILKDTSHKWCIRTGENK